jgi:hypothetical protein
VELLVAVLIVSAAATAAAAADAAAVADLVSVSQRSAGASAEVRQVTVLSRSPSRITLYLLYGNCFDPGDSFIVGCRRLVKRPGGAA